MQGRGQAISFLYIQILHNNCSHIEDVQRRRRSIQSLVFFFLYWEGGNINQPGQLAPRGEDNQGGGKIPQGILPPPGTSCPEGGGGKIA